MRKYSRKQKKMQVKNGVAEGQRRVCLPGGEVIINARAELLETAVEAGFQVVKAMLLGGCREALWFLVLPPEEP